MSKKMKAYEILYFQDWRGDADIESVVMVSTSKSQAVIDLVNEENVYWIDSIRLLTEFEVKDDTEAKEVIEGLLAALSKFEPLATPYKHCLPAIEKAKEFLKGE